MRLGVAGTGPGVLAAELPPRGVGMRIGSREGVVEAERVSGVCVESELFDAGAKSGGLDLPRGRVDATGSKGLSSTRAISSSIVSRASRSGCDSLRSIPRSSALSFLGLETGTSWGAVVPDWVPRRLNW